MERRFTVLGYTGQTLSFAAIGAGGIALVAGAALLVAGAALLVAGRRRRRVSTAVTDAD